MLLYNRCQVLSLNIPKRRVVVYKNSKKYEIHQSCVTSSRHARDEFFARSVNDMIQTLYAVNQGVMSLPTR